MVEILVMRGNCAQEPRWLLIDTGANKSRDDSHFFLLKSGFRAVDEELRERGWIFTAHNSESKPSCKIYFLCSHTKNG